MGLSWENLTIELGMKGLNTSVGDKQKVAFLPCPRACIRTLHICTRETEPAGQNRAFSTHAQ